MAHDSCWYTFDFSSRIPCCLKHKLKASLGGNWIYSTKLGRHQACWRLGRWIYTTTCAVASFFLLKWRPLPYWLKLATASGRFSNISVILTSISNYKSCQIIIKSYKTKAFINTCCKWMRQLCIMRWWNVDQNVLIKTSTWHSLVFTVW